MSTLREIKIETCRTCSDLCRLLCTPGKKQNNNLVRSCLFSVEGVHGKHYIVSWVFLSNDIENCTERKRERGADYSFQRDI